MRSVLRERLAGAGAHAMRIRSAPESRVVATLEVLPVGVEVSVRHYGREKKQLLGWDTIEDAKINLLIERIDYFVSTIDQRA